MEKKNKFIHKFIDRLSDDFLEKPSRMLGLAIICSFVMLMTIGVVIGLNQNQTSIEDKQPYPYIVGSEYPEGTMPLYNLESFFAEFMNLKMPFLFWVLLIIVLILLIK